MVRVPPDVHLSLGFGVGPLFGRGLGGGRWGLGGRPADSQRDDGRQGLKVARGTEDALGYAGGPSVGCLAPGLEDLLGFLRVAREGARERVEGAKRQCDVGLVVEVEDQGQLVR